VGIEWGDSAERHGFALDEALNAIFHAMELSDRYRHLLNERDDHEA
jgi:hypothetical protein